MSAVADLAKSIAGLTLAQAVELKDLLKKDYGIEPAAGGAVMMAGPAAGAAPAEKPAEATEFNVVLEGVVDAPSKIKVIKIVRELTGQGLAEAKATVEGAPKNIKEGIDKKTAEELKKKIEAEGGKVSVKPA
jgi:large subunit ribosomal protein L7/L12